MNDAMNYAPKFKIANESLIFLLAFSSYIFFKVVKIERATHMLTHTKKCLKVKMSSSSVQEELE